LVGEFRRATRHEEFEAARKMLGEMMTQVKLHLANREIEMMLGGPDFQWAFLVMMGMPMKEAGEMLRRYNELV
jgi:hypothetical protein